MTTAGYALGLTWKYPTKGQCTMPDSTAPTYTAEDVHAAYTQGRRDASKDTQAYTQGWADGHRNATEGLDPATLLRMKATAWREGRESLVQDLNKPIGDDGRRPVTPNPYEKDGEPT